MDERRVPSGVDHSFVVEHVMRASPAAIFEAWTHRFDAWFASPGYVSMDPVVDRAFWFDTYFEGVHHPHYGRFLQLERDQLIELTWVTGMTGTDGAETVVRVGLSALDSGTLLRLTHGGFYDEAAARRHQDAWPRVLGHLDEVLSDEE
ncbi:MAG: SRPBCC domain-containing protein [Acidimicrobiales bacterium]